MSEQGSFFAPDHSSIAKPISDAVGRLRVLITVKAAPNPSALYGETVCVAGMSVELEPRWIRLYPINFRYLDQETKFKKYDVVTVDATPARNDQRVESWRPHMGTLKVERHLAAWKPREPLVRPFIEESMCLLNRDATADHKARSLGLVRAKEVSALELEPHPGWSDDEVRKIDTYVNQLDLFGGEDKTALQAPRLKGYYRWRCYESGCNGHRQGVIDWEFVALQRRYPNASDPELSEVLRAKFLEQLCGPTRDVAFYVGNQAKRAHVFSVLGVYWPPRS